MALLQGVFFLVILGSHGPEEILHTSSSYPGSLLFLEVNIIILLTAICKSNLNEFKIILILKNDFFM